MQDNPADNLPDTRWVSFAELAAARGISKASAIRLIRRHGWRRQRDNEGHVRALIPETWLNGQEDRPPDWQPDNPGDNLPDTTFHLKALSVLEDALATLREAKDGEIATLRDTVGGLRDTVAKAEARAVHAEQRAVEADARIAEAEQAARIALGTVETLRRAEEVRKARGRLRRAWDGWRGR